MLTHVFIALVLSNTAFCQINGEFWWLNKDFAAIHNIEPPQPIFEDISESETDESVKVVFKENELTFDKRPSDKENEDKFLVQNKILPYIVFIDDPTKLTKRDVIKNNSINTNSNINSYEDEVKNSTNTVSWKETYKNKDELKFTFPDDGEVTIKNFTHMNGTKDTNITNGNNEMQRNPKIVLNDKIWFEEERKDTETESICTFVSRHECFLRKGFVHMPQSCPKNIPADECKICCVLPLTSSKSRKPYLLYKRQKRSDSGELLSAALKQRNALLLREYNSNAQQPKLVTTTLRTNPLHKIVTPGDSVDPYWNIKSQKFRRPNQNKPNFKDYDEDYAAEIPKPGLVGLYSDREDQVMTWKLKKDKGWHGSYGGIDEDSYEDETGGGFGYSTVDPRFGTRKTTASNQRRRPQRFMTPSTVEDATRTSESQTVHFHSTPDFRVLEGFKLINLAENKNKYIKRTTSENFYPGEEDLSIENTSPFYIPNLDVDLSDAFDLNIQVFKNCGKEKVQPASDTSPGKGTEGRCDPWLVVVVLTKNPENILCYATIVHPRAAVTAASCVHGKATGEISAIAGVWDLKERTQSQHRMASILVHPQFNADDLANDLALLHWKRPLMLQPNVSPACLADPHVGDECYFVGWGGYDQALKQRPQWQHATILTPSGCNDKISSPEVDIPADAFCTAVGTRGTVTGVGGPLLCRAGDRVSVVGVAVYRENVVVLLPALEWVTSGLRELQIN